LIIGPVLGREDAIVSVKERYDFLEQWRRTRQIDRAKRPNQLIQKGDTLSGISRHL
jgi:hypothetical protein